MSASNPINHGIKSPLCKNPESTISLKCKLLKPWNPDGEYWKSILPIGFMGFCTLYLPTRLVDFYGINVGKYNIDGSYGLYIVVVLETWLENNHVDLAQCFFANELQANRIEMPVWFCFLLGLRSYKFRITKIQQNYNTPVEHTPGNPPSQLWKESLYSLLVKV